jgi:hypothetical protein
MKDDNKQDGLQEEREQLQGAGGANSDHQNASATRGGTTDMDHHGLHGGSGNTSRATHGSGISTKRTVTGSDFDGQVADQ